MTKFPRLVIAATHSGAGKTTLTCGIIAALRKRGLKVQPYKVGPDYIDTGFHELAAGRPAQNLDSWLVGKDKIVDVFNSAYGDADIAIIEGVMGLYDGGRGGISSTAEIAKILDAQVILIIDAKSVGTSAAATALGFREFDKDVKLAGVILNRVGSTSHEKIITDALNKIGIESFGAVKRDDEIVFPSRHLGLVQASEINFDFDKLADKIAAQINLDSLLVVSGQWSEIKKFSPYHLTPNPYSLKIGIARDEAFTFYYAESLRELERRGAELIFFSPIHDENLPQVDALIIGGGYPELYAGDLERNKKLRTAIKRAADDGLPIYAECGGYMYLMDALTNLDGKIFEMCGVIPNQAVMTDKLQMVGYVDATITKDCIIGKRGDKIHAHEFHFSKALNSTGKEIFNCEKLRTGEKYFAGYADKNIVASYLHMSFKNFGGEFLGRIDGRKFNQGR